MANAPIYTPWGGPQQTGDVAEGIAWYSTASHGGFWVSPDRQKVIDRVLPGVKVWAGRPWYEEDCDWCLVVLALPTVFVGIGEKGRRDIYYAYRTGKQRTDLPTSYWSSIEGVLVRDIWNDLVHQKAQKDMDYQSGFLAALDGLPEGGPRDKNGPQDFGLWGPRQTQYLMGYDDGRLVVMETRGGR